jgi:hypothetical protein
VIELELSTSSINSSLGKYSEFLAIPGFMWGVTKNWASMNSGTYPFSYWGVCDVIASVLGKKAAKIINPNYTGGADFSFNPNEIFNNGTYAYIALWLAKEVLGGKWINFAAKYGMPLAAGYAIGSLFDPPPVQGNYSEANNSTGLGQMTYPSLAGF